MNLEAVITVIISVFSSSLFTVIVSSVILEPIREKINLYLVRNNHYISLLLCTLK